jgi:eukaryotic-like serine/threonine-protein kinase
MSSSLNNGAGGGRPEATGGPASASGEATVIRAVQEYLAALEAGQEPDRREFLEHYAAVAGPLAECLDGLDLQHRAAPELSEPAAVALAENEPSAGGICSPEPLGDYRILREVGRGGMGVVYEAEQLSLGRRVALKLLPFAAALDARHLQRFKNEAQAAAHLHHPHIVPVYAVGCERGVHYYAMQFIDRQTLAALIDELRRMTAPRGPEEKPPFSAPSRVAHELVSGGLDPWRTRLDGPAAAAAAPGPVPRPASRTASRPSAGVLSSERSTKSQAFFRTVANLGVQAAEALEHAHQLGVVHRDVKPANLLLDDRGKLWVTDFGLAQVHGDTKLTETGDLVGTLRYMSPEQALAKRVPVDHRTDVYSLGTTLYELLTLVPAFPGRDRQEVLRQIAFEEPRPPRRAQKAIPAELETIVLKAMAKNPGDRYGTAQELADDLKRFVDGLPIRARKVGPGKRALLWARRRPAVAGLLGASTVAGLALAALVVGLLFHARLQAALDQA